MPCCKLKLMRLGIVLLSLTSCAGAGSKPAALIDRDRGINPCATIPLRPYTQAQQTRVAAEIDAAPPDAAWPDFVRDYGAMRAALRACRAVP